MSGRQSDKNSSAAASAKSGLIQFRADGELIERLSQIADQLSIPVGVLARLWVAERLQQELSLSKDSIEKWLANAHAGVKEKLKDLEPGPIQIIHLIPFQQQLSLEASQLRRYHGQLPPVERVDDYDGRINLSGYITTKQFRGSDTPTAFVQVYRSGQIESVRVLQHDEDDKALFLDQVDDDLITAVWSYTSVLQQLGVNLPIGISIGFTRIKGYCFRSRSTSEPSGRIDLDDFIFPLTVISKWSQAEDLDSVAETLKPSLDMLANSAGIPKSPSYSVRGSWLGPEEKRFIMNAKVSSSRKNSPVVTITGLNPGAGMVDLMLHENGRKVLIGKVRRPVISLPQNVIYSIIVYQDAMTPAIKVRLRALEASKLASEFTLGDQTIRGRVSRLVEGYGGGAFDGVNIPNQQTMSFLIEPVDG